MAELFSGEACRAVMEQCRDLADSSRLRDSSGGVALVRVLAYQWRTASTSSPGETSSGRERPAEIVTHPFVTASLVGPLRCGRLRVSIPVSGGGFLRCTRFFDFVK